MPIDRAGVEVSGWLVAQQDRRVIDERAGDRDALLLAAREFVRKPLLLAGEPNEIEHLRHRGVDDVALLADHLQRESDVLVHRLVGQQAEVLEHRADLAAQLRHAPTGQPVEVATGDVDVACRGAFLAQNELEKGRLPGARGANEEDEVAAFNLHGDVVKRGLGAARVDLADTCRI